MKEYRVYLLPTDINKFINAQEIESWIAFEKECGKICKDAEEFITLCEKNGTVHTLISFQNLANYEHIGLDYNWIYITNNY